LERIGDSLRWKVSAWLVQNAPEMLTTHDIDVALEAKPPSIHQRAMQMLRWLSLKYFAGDEFGLKELGRWNAYTRSLSSAGLLLAGEVTSSPLVPIGWCRSVAEMNFMITEVLCNEMGLLQSQNNRDYQISPKGWLTLEGVPNASSQIGFCAMWFNEEVKQLWIEVIEPAIRESGYEPLRIDGKQHNGKIDDEIMASIRASKFVVSDFTGNRGGVYYEAGFAHGLGLPVVFMCRQGEELHFDVRQYNTIFWKPEQLQEAKSNLKNRILATLGTRTFAGAMKKSIRRCFSLCFHALLSGNLPHCSKQLRLG
jgi:nucleoside 2-deoxyribosyltransferase